MKKTAYAKLEDNPLKGFDEGTELDGSKSTESEFSWNISRDSGSELDENTENSPPEILNVNEEHSHGKSGKNEQRSGGKKIFKHLKTPVKTLLKKKSVTPESSMHSKDDIAAEIPIGSEYSVSSTESAETDSDIITLTCRKNRRSLNEKPTQPSFGSKIRFLSKSFKKTFKSTSKFHVDTKGAFPATPARDFATFSAFKQPHSFDSQAA
jgi:hypothetical protein